jgi:hypothetical protein
MEQPAATEYMKDYKFIFMHSIPSKRAFKCHGLPNERLFMKTQNKAGVLLLDKMWRTCNAKMRILCMYGANHKLLELCMKVLRIVAMSR